MGRDRVSSWVATTTTTAAAAAAAPFEPRAGSPVRVILHARGGPLDVNVLLRLSVTMMGPVTGRVHLGRRIRQGQSVCPKPTLLFFDGCDGSDAGGRDLGFRCLIAGAALGRHAERTFRPGGLGATSSATAAAAATTMAPLLPEEPVRDEGFVLLAFEHRASLLGVQRQHIFH